MMIEGDQASKTGRPASCSLEGLDPLSWQAACRSPRSASCHQLSIMVARRSGSAAARSRQRRGRENWACVAAYPSCFAPLRPPIFPHSEVPPWQPRRQRWRTCRPPSRARGPGDPAFSFLRGQQVDSSGCICLAPTIYRSNAIGINFNLFSGLSWWSRGGSNP